MLLKEIAGAHSPHDHRLSEHRIYLIIFVLLIYVLAASLVPRVEHVAKEDKASVLITFLVAVPLNLGLTTLGHGEHEHGPSEGDLSSPR